MKLFQITEEDLQSLERDIPAIYAECMATSTLAQKRRFREIQRILRDVRWNYGPHAEVEVVDP